MKKIYFYLILLVGAICCLPSCNDEWEDELYTRMISLKAPIKDDVSPIYLRYKSGEGVTYKLPVIVSGSRKNDQNYTVHLDVDNDTLQHLNKFAERSDLYFKQLPAQFYEFPSKTCQVPAGQDVANYLINFKFEGLDLVDRWVLPVTVTPHSSYTLNTYKGRQKALLWVIPFNDYSGTYSATSMFVYFGNNTTKYMSASSRETRVVNENTIFFYAGVTEELAENRGDFKVKCQK